MSATPKTWTRTGPKCGGTWTHTSGAVVRHCGHPTALYPYAAYPADGIRVILHDGDPRYPNGYGCFARLREAQAEALKPAAP